ncbi:hypothetical protein G7Z17_g12803 [Cylindrodendrum hubeiense]|uniref:Uncharacterized protein n=1 Tax=Cylindrodendrum hubeiense TaxID=595255 RepID=A0A9P5LA85_9HYPO|nr:hypothetical protein G7Z17_g12803 [Cylindrodendrum hubeiense]
MGRDGSRWVETGRNGIARYERTAFSVQVVDIMRANVAPRRWKQANPRTNHLEGQACGAGPSGLPAAFQWATPLKVKFESAASRTGPEALAQQRNPAAFRTKQEASSKAWMGVDRGCGGAGFLAARPPPQQHQQHQQLPQQHYPRRNPGMPPLQLAPAAEDSRPLGCSRARISQGV